MSDNLQVQTEEVKKFKFSLIKAQKYLDKLRSHFKNSNGKKSKNIFRNEDSGFNPKTTVSLSQITSLTTDQPKAQELLDEFISNAKNEVVCRMVVAKNLKELKELVYSTNASVGLSRVLSFMERLGEERSIYENIKKTYENDKSLYESTQLSLLMERFSKLSPESNDPVRTSTIRVYDIKELDKKITQYTRDIEVLENERDRLNALTMIEFSFSNETIKILGL